VTWQEQARSFLSSAPMSAAERVRVIGLLQEAHRGEVGGAIAGVMANMVVQYLMGGPHMESPPQMFARFAQGCRAFLAAYEAERE
jgi:hypothetical protein